MVIEIGIVAGDGFAIHQVLRLEVVAVRRQNKLRLILRRRRTLPQRRQRVRHCPRRAHLDVNVAALQHPTQVRLVGTALGALELLDRRRFVAKRFEKGKGKLVWVKGRFGELGNGFFDLDCIHRGLAGGNCSQ